MTLTNREISDTLSRYLADHPAEHDSLTPLLSSLAADAEVTSRQTVPGHVTCSAAVINNTGQVLMIRHNALNRWLLPGGHLDPADHCLLAAAQRELAEETGISIHRPVSAPELGDLPLDIDLHRIPANQAKGEAAHWHADLRFAFFVTDPAVLLQLEEVSDYIWRPPSSLHTTRLAAKVARLAA
jgi:8-oxo-dGTP pyrophosphatase MutT (NUDIX family)